MIKNRDQVIETAKQLRKNGLSHRQIASKLQIGLGTAVVFTPQSKLDEKLGFLLK